MRPGAPTRSARTAALLALSCGLVACAGDDLPSNAQRPVPAPPASAPPLADTDPAPPASASTDVRSWPRPYRGRLGAAVTLNAACVSCHLQEAAEWRGSLHRRSDTEAAYRRAFAIEPSPFCRGCHAPEADPGKTPSFAVSDLGVGCVSCHVTREDGAVLASASSRAAGPARASGAPHPLFRSADFAGTGGCAGCHEFRFPAPRGDDDDDYMQTTAREHARSPAAAEACAACHMPLVGGRRSHAFAEVRDPAWLRDHLEARAERIDDHRVRLSLVQRAGGHGFPTGDLFRRLEIGCELRDAGGKVLRRDVRYLARHFEVVPGQPGRQIVGDDRLFDAPVSVELGWDPPSPPDPRARVSWWVSYQRVATAGTGKNPGEAKVESEVRLREGVLPEPGYAGSL